MNKNSKNIQFSDNMMNGITNYILLITLLIYGSRAPAQNVKQENDSVKMNKPFNMDGYTDEHNI